ncbi:MAG TPA: hypothetical protein VLH84_04900 [Patescibacteria group bacterium]|nr:hypothetical protein [Patescibacteria group bacterium]
MRPQLFKYKVGLGIIGVFVLVMAVFVLLQADNAKKDIATDKAANDIAQKLNDYVDTQQTIPESLDTAGIKDVPDTITYQRLSDSSYKFCVKYKSASTGLDSTTLLQAATSFDTTGSGFTDSSQPDPVSNPSSLYISANHKKGANCQTVEPYNYGYGMYPTGGGGTNSTGTSASTAQYCNTDFLYDLTVVDVNAITPPSGGAKGSITVATYPAAKTFDVSPSVKVLDTDCKPLSISDIQVGGAVDIHSDTSDGPVTTIIKEF